MFCNYCGTPCPDNAHYCGSCGQRIAQQPPPQTAPTSARQENLTDVEPSAMPGREPSKEELFRRIDELERKLAQDDTKAPPPIQAPPPEDFELDPQDIDWGVPTHPVHKGFIRRIKEGVHWSVCRMKVRTLVLNRTAELLQRRVTRNVAEEQARKELGLFVALLEDRNIDTTTKQGVLFLEANFPSFTRMLDSKKINVNTYYRTRT